ncbi:MAG: hypothetical protein OSA97_04820 [Nevskia sp.]|nr:hypothetical protein [Nevskia sp.]
MSTGIKCVDAAPCAPQQSRDAARIEVNPQALQEDGQNAIEWLPVYLFCILSQNFVKVVYSYSNQ